MYRSFCLYYFLMNELTPWLIFGGPEISTFEVSSTFSCLLNTTSKLSDVNSAFLKYLACFSLSFFTFRVRSIMPLAES